MHTIPEAMAVAIQHHQADALAGSTRSRGQRASRGQALQRARGVSDAVRGVKPCFRAFAGSTLALAGSSPVSGLRVRFAGSRALREGFAGSKPCFRLCGWAIRVLSCGHGLDPARRSRVLPRAIYHVMSRGNPETGPDPGKPVVTPRSLFVVAGPPTLNRKQGLSPREAFHRKQTSTLGSPAWPARSLFGGVAGTPTFKPETGLRILRSPA